MKSHKLIVSDDAEGDILAIVEYILRRDDGVASALAIEERLDQTIASLAGNPARGRVVPELRQQGIRAFRELLISHGGLCIVSLVVKYVL